MRSSRCADSRNCSECQSEFAVVPEKNSNYIHLFSILWQYSTYNKCILYKSADVILRNDWPGGMAGAAAKRQAAGK